MSCLSDLFTAAGPTVASAKVGSEGESRGILVLVMPKRSRGTSLNSVKEDISMRLGLVDMTEAS